MDTDKSGQIDDDLSNLDGLINFSFNCLVPSMTPPSTDADKPSTSTCSQPIGQDEKNFVHVNLLNTENTPRRPQIPSSNLPLVAPNGAKKPPHTYPELIEYAIERCGPLTVSQIYSWIMSTFPYFQSIGDIRWKPGIRHTLTTHHLFKKVRKDQKLRGWQWSLVPEEERKRNKVSQQASAHWKKQKMQQYEKIMNEKDYNPNTAYLQLQQQIQKQIYMRHRFQQRQPHSGSPYKTWPLARIGSEPVASGSKHQQYAVVNTKEFFRIPPCENDSAVLASQQDTSLSLDEGCQTNITIPSSSSSGSIRHGLLHEKVTPSLSVLNGPALVRQGTSFGRLADRIREEPLAVDPANFTLVDPTLEITPHPNVGLLQIHRPNCEACIGHTVPTVLPGVGSCLWGVERERSPSPHPLDLSMHSNSL